MTTQGDKLTKQLGDADLATALVAAGLGLPGDIEAAQDSAVEDAVGSENLAAVRVVFPGAQE
jgi:hypothetical protein